MSQYYNLTAINEAANKLMLNVDVNLLQESSISDLQRAESKKLIYENIQFVKEMCANSLIQEGKESLAAYWGSLIQESFEELVPGDFEGDLGRTPALNTAASANLGNAVNNTLAGQEAAHTNTMKATGNAMNATLAGQDAKINSLQHNANNVAQQSFNAAERSARDANNTVGNIVQGHADLAKGDAITKANEIAANNPAIGNTINSVLAAKDNAINQVGTTMNNAGTAVVNKANEIAANNPAIGDTINSGLAAKDNLANRATTAAQNVGNTIADNPGTSAGIAAGLAGAGLGAAGANLVRRRTR